MSRPVNTLDSIGQTLGGGGFSKRGISVSPPLHPDFCLYRLMYLLVYQEGLRHLTSMRGWPQRTRGSRRSRSAHAQGCYAKESIF